MPPFNSRSTLSASPQFGSVLACLGAFFTLLGLPCLATVPSAKELKVNFEVGPIKADPVRNLVYFVDATNNRLYALDTSLGQVAARVPIEDGSTSGELAISIDGTKLYLAETAENKILVFSLPALTPLPAIPLDFPPYSIASGVNGRLFATESFGTLENDIVELNPTSGAVLQTFGSTERYYYLPLLRLNDSGTNLYAAITGISGQEQVEKYAISGAVGTAVSTATGYAYNSANMIDFTPDEKYGRIYVMNGGIYGVNVITTANDNYSTVWPLTGAYGVAVGYNKGTSIVYGASGDFYGGDVRAYSRTDGAPLADYVVAGDTDTFGDEVQDQSLVETANGDAFYVRSDSSSDPGNSYLGLISTNPKPITLALPQTLTFPAISNKNVGASFALNGKASSGLAVTYTTSGHVTISGNIATVTSAGTISIRANQAGNSAYLPAPSILQTFTASQIAQTITFPIIPSQFVGAKVTLKATASSGLPVSYTLTSGSATLSGNVLTLTGAGTVSVTASQAGSAIYKAATSVPQSFVVSQKTQTITFPTITNKTYPSTAFSTGATASSGLPITYTATGPVKVSGNTLTLTGVGTVNIRAHQDGNAEYEAAPTVLHTFTVTAAKP